MAWADYLEAAPALKCVFLFWFMEKKVEWLRGSKSFIFTDNSDVILCTFFFGFWANSLCIDRFSVNHIEWQHVNSWFHKKKGKRKLHYLIKLCIILEQNKCWCQLKSRHRHGYLINNPQINYILSSVLRDTCIYIY